MSTPTAIEKLVRRAGATRFVYDWSPNQCLIGFTLDNRSIRIPVTLPDPNDHQFTRTPSRGDHRAPSVAQKLYEEAIGQVWSELADLIRVKMRLIRVGRSTVEQEFLAQIVLGDGSTVAQWLGPQIEQTYASGVLVPLLMAPKEAAHNEQ